MMGVVKNRTIVVIIVVALLVVGTLWLCLRGPRSRGTASTRRTTTMQLTGSPGARFTGYYVRQRRRVAVSGTLPETFTDTGVSKSEFRKDNAEDALALEVRDGVSFMSFRVDAGMRGVKANMEEGGWNVGIVKD